MSCEAFLHCVTINARAFLPKGLRLPSPTMIKPTMAVLATIHWTHLLWLATLCSADEARPARVGLSTILDKDYTSSELSVNLPSDQCQSLGSPFLGQLRSFKPSMGTFCTAFE